MSYGIELREVRKQEGSAMERGEMDCGFGGETGSLDEQALKNPQP
jgi:hypothetical protein